jgi:hypothetical protein
MALTLLKVAIIGYSLGGTRFHLITLYTLGLGYGSFNSLKRSNSSFGWLVTTLRQPSLYSIIAR